MEAGLQDRAYWVEILDKIARPVLLSLATRTLKIAMPAEGKRANLEEVRYLEALGRTLAGISPWLELEGLVGEEKVLQEEYRHLAREALDAATDPESPDYLCFTNQYGDQPLVDTAFLAHGIIRAKRQLWDKLDSRVQNNLVSALKQVRQCKAHYCNWLLFAAMIETALYKMEKPYDQMRIDYALMEHEQWYKGDGIYGDGPDFRWDYYNSFVIQPMLVDIITTVGQERSNWMILKDSILERAKRYAAVQERLISPEGTFPPIGRSLAYRFGAFQHLAQMALQHYLPNEITPSQVRCGLTAVIKNMMEMDGTFDGNGWLQIGFCGFQPDLGESYINTGSLYLCTTVFLPLGLLPSDSFWCDKEQDWTSKKIWKGRNYKADQAL
ncbi:MAG: DUF2264 domain-containing protein [Epulopiscium sp.]|nr:DUF2264 domain-containing protein [Candidatus Epulonipiscium sp.]